MSDALHSNCLFCFNWDQSKISHGSLGRYIKYLYCWKAVWNNICSRHQKIQLPNILSQIQNSLHRQIFGKATWIVVLRVNEIFFVKPCHTYCRSVNVWCITTQGKATEHAALPQGDILLFKLHMLQHEIFQFHSSVCTWLHWIRSENL